MNSPGRPRARGSGAWPRRAGAGPRPRGCAEATEAAERLWTQTARDGRARRARGDPRRQPPLPRRGGRRVRRQVGDLVRRDRPPAGARQAHEAARPAARAVRALAGDRRRHRLLHAQPDAGRRRSRRRPARTSRPGMLATLERNAERARPRRRDRRPATPPSCPSTDESFDLVLGHAVLHHLPDLDRAFAEFRRVLRAGRDAVLRRRAVAHRATGIAAVPKRAGGARRAAVAPARCARAPRARHGDAAATTGRPRARGRRRRPRVRARPTSSAAPRGAGFDDVRVRGEELLANWFGWFNRTLEATAEPEDIPWGWIQYAYRGYIAAAARRPARCSSRACRRGSSTT